MTIRFHKTSSFTLTVDAGSKRNGNTYEVNDLGFIIGREFRLAWFLTCCGFVVYESKCLSPGTEVITGFWTNYDRFEELFEDLV